MSPQSDLSIINRLLDTISWDGNLVSRYRHGGLGLENVLTAEVLQGLDFLPRQHFLGAVIQALHGEIERARAKLLDEIEQATVSLLAEDFYLRPSRKTHAAMIDVQPDGYIQTPGVYALIEAKRIKASSFQAEQLAREYVVVTREARERLPLLVLMLGKAPPVKIEESGRKSIHSAIADKLEVVLEKTEGHPLSLAELQAQIDSTVAWITWDEIASIVAGQSLSFKAENASTRAAIQRVVDTITSAEQRHR